MISKRSLSAFVVGTVFGLGLAISQMANPEKVLAFLNIAGLWDASLLLVMGAATGIALFGFRWAMSKTPVFETRHYVPDATEVDRRLIAGAAVFGVGWGLAGYCPGPAITALASGSIEPPLFVAAMIAGSQLQVMRKSTEQVARIYSRFEETAMRLALLPLIEIASGWRLCQMVLDLFDDFWWQYIPTNTIGEQPQEMIEKVPIDHEFVH